MKMKGFASVFLAVTVLNSYVYAQTPDIYVSWANEDGVIVTSDTDLIVKLIVADYDDSGRLINACENIVGVNAGDNAYAYETLGAAEQKGQREILLWRGEAESIEPICAMPLSHPEDMEYAKAFVAGEKNGLTDGLGPVKLNDAITRKQIKAVITNAMGDFVIDTGEDYDSDETLTCAQAYVLLAKVFDFDWYTLNYLSGKKEYVGKVDSAVLEGFADKESVAGYEEYAACIVGNGGFDGFNGLLKGDSLITVGEFMYLMDEIIGTYVDEPGTYTTSDFEEDKTVVIRSGDVVVDMFTTDRNLIVAYSVGASPVKITDSVVNGVTSIMGCADPEKKTSYISIKGDYFDVRVNTGGIILDASGADMEYYRGVKDSIVRMGMF